MGTANFETLSFFRWGQENDLVTWAYGFWPGCFLSYSLKAFLSCAWKSFKDFGVGLTFHQAQLSSSYWWVQNFHLSLVLIIEFIYGSLHNTCKTDGPFSNMLKHPISSCISLWAWLHTANSSLSQPRLHENRSKIVKNMQEVWSGLVPIGQWHCLAQGPVKEADMAV